MHMGGQEHFYMETHVTLAVPRGEDGEMELFVSTQSPSKTQVTSLLFLLFLLQCPSGTVFLFDYICEQNSSPCLFQFLVAKALGVPANRVVVRVKRLGGGFGGKESRATLLSTVVAVAADKYISLSLTCNVIQ